MTNVATLVRQSQGSEDSISLELQREQTDERAAELGDDDPERVDLGVHTGFSIFVKRPDQERIDDNEQVLGLLDDLAAGAYDYLVAHDDTRLARDQFYWVLVWHAQRGDCTVEFIEDVPSDDLTFRVGRVVEAEMKRKEIEKARRAKQRRVEQGMYDGGVPLGLQFDEQGEYLIRDSDEWEAIEAVFECLAEGKTYKEIVAEVDGINSTGTITNIRDRRERYEQFGELPNV